MPGGHEKARRTMKPCPLRKSRLGAPLDSRAPRWRCCSRFPPEVQDQAQPEARARDSRPAVARRNPPEKLPPRKSKRNQEGEKKFAIPARRHAPAAQGGVRGALLVLIFEGRIFPIDQADCAQRASNFQLFSQAIHAHDCGSGGGGGGVRRDMRASIFAANSSSFAETSRRNDAVRRSVSGAISSST